MTERSSLFVESCGNPGGTESGLQIPVVGKAGHPLGTAGRRAVPGIGRRRHLLRHRLPVGSEERRSFGVPSPAFRWFVAVPGVPQTARGAPVLCAHQRVDMHEGNRAETESRSPGPAGQRRHEHMRYQGSPGVGAATNDAGMSPAPLGWTHPWTGLSSRRPPDSTMILWGARVVRVLAPVADATGSGPARGEGDRLPALRLPGPVFPGDLCQIEGDIDGRRRAGAPPVTGETAPGRLVDHPSRHRVAADACPLGAARGRKPAGRHHPPRGGGEWSAGPAGIEPASSGSSWTARRPLRYSPADGQRTTRHRQALATAAMPAPGGVTRSDGRPPLAGLDRAVPRMSRQVAHGSVRSLNRAGSLEAAHPAADERRSRRQRAPAPARPGHRNPAVTHRSRCALIRPCPHRCGGPLPGDGARNASAITGSRSRPWIASIQGRINHVGRDLLGCRNSAVTGGSARPRWGDNSPGRESLHGCGRGRGLTRFR